MSPHNSSSYFYSHGSEELMFKDELTDDSFYKNLKSERDGHVWISW